MSHQLPITMLTRRVLHAIFPTELWERVEQMLRNDCGSMQLHAHNFGNQAMERIWLAALKASAGSIGHLENAVLLAQVDWRDLLVSAGFGSDATAHLRCADEIAR